MSEESEEQYDEEDEEEEESEDEEKDKEPKLKYVRMGTSVPEILKNDSASCMAVHSKFLVLGTHTGLVYILDFLGTTITKFKSQHDSRVVEISIDKAGEFVASCAEDGKVIINDLTNLPSTTTAVVHSFSRPLNCVALDPDYYKNRKERFVCGGKAGRLILSEKAFFIGYSQTVLHENEGCIHAIAWGSNNNLIAWANDLGTKVWDCVSKERISYIDKPRGPRPDLYRCCLCWENDSTLIIGWGDFIKIAQVKDRNPPLDGLPSKFLEITAVISTNDYFICGIAPFQSDLIIMAFTEPEDKKSMHSERPELRIISREITHEGGGKDISVESLAINNYKSYTARDYRLDYNADESLFYLVSPKDIVIAKPRDIDDHITWLLERKRFEEALLAGKTKKEELKKHSLIALGELYLNHLIDLNQAGLAASRCPEILGNNQKLWEKWILYFGDKGQLKAIGPWVPVENPKLHINSYQTVLRYYLDNDPPGFLKLIREWPADIFTPVIGNLIRAVEDRGKDNENLRTAISILYSHNKQYDKTLEIYLELGNGQVFDLIQNNDLFEFVREKVLGLMKFDEKKAIALLLQNTAKIPIASVVKQLESYPTYQLHYLHELFFHSKKGELNQDAKEYHDKQVALYAYHEPEHLYQFLEKSNYWNLEEALRICQTKHLWKENVFIFVRMGNIEEALTLMIEKVGDVKQAIEFVQKQNDENLWDELIAKSIKNPQFVSGLLENVGTHINPLKLIEKIPKGMEIQGLRSRLVKIINDYLLQTSLSQGCKEVLKADVITLSHRLQKGNSKAIRVDKDTRCSISNVPVMPTGKRKSVLVFFCNHIFLEEELDKANNAATNKPPSESLETPKFNCPICRQISENNRPERKQRVAQRNK